MSRLKHKTKGGWLLAIGCWLLMAGYGLRAEAQQVNDSNTPLHLMKPAYRLKYGVSKPEDVKTTMDRVLAFIENETPAEVVNKKTGQQLPRWRDINGDAQLKPGGFRLTSYEWGVTYSGALAAWAATGDERYANYAETRMKFLSDVAPYFKKVYGQVKDIDPNIRRVIDPHSLDDAGAICTAMIKQTLTKRGNLALDSLIDNYADYVLTRQYRLSDGTFARTRPHRNTLWLDDMFMGIPTMAWMGKRTSDTHLFDQAVSQIEQFAQRMFVAEKRLFRHGWVEGFDAQPTFHWGRANGWALLTLCEVLDALPTDYPQRYKVLNLLRQHIQGLAALQHHDGFWHQLLDRNDTYLETSCTAIFTYCIAHAVNQGWISAQAYGPVAQLGWHAVESMVDEQGRVLGVCVGTGMGFDPAFYAYRPVHPMAAHGYGPLLLAGAEIIRLLKQQHPKLNDSAVHFYDEEIKTDSPIFNFDNTVRY